MAKFSYRNQNQKIQSISLQHPITLDFFLDNLPLSLSCSRIIKTFRKSFFSKTVADRKTSRVIHITKKKIRKLREGLREDGKNEKKKSRVENSFCFFPIECKRVSVHSVLFRWSDQIRLSACYLKQQSIHNFMKICFFEAFLFLNGS